MSFFDILLVLIIVGFGLVGLWLGLVQTIGSLIGTILGVYLAFRFYSPVAVWIMSITGWQGNITKVVVFIVSFVVINRLVGLVFWLLNKFLGIFTKLPFINSANKLLGLIFGLIEGALVVGVALYFISRFPLGAKFMAALAASKIAPHLDSLISVLKPFIPDAIKLIKSTIGLF
ncbi:MAG: CvpA family protein [Candidatus Magasanikbacteria bacterium]|nr:CvpA family protein [Candidatus Magasanikbacteria bacterium]